MRWELQILGEPSLASGPEFGADGSSVESFLEQSHLNPPGLWIFAGEGSVW